MVCSYSPSRATTIHKASTGGVASSKGRLWQDGPVCRITLSCQENPAVTLKDCPVSRFQELLDNANSDEQRILWLVITERDVQELDDERRNRWRKKPRSIETEFSESTEEKTKSSPPWMEYEYSDDSDGDIEPPLTWTFLDSMIESKWGLDGLADEVLPVIYALGLKRT